MSPYPNNKNIDWHKYSLPMWKQKMEGIKEWRNSL